jgi:hypothetical protein
MWELQIVQEQWPYTESGNSKKPLDAGSFKIVLEELHISASVHTFVQNSSGTHHT